jgi:hypothetical protein
MAISRLKQFKSVLLYETIWYPHDYAYNRNSI